MLTVSDDPGDWRTPIIQVLESNEEDKAKFTAERKREAHRYAKIGEVLYKQGFTSALFR